MIKYGVKPAIVLLAAVVGLTACAEMAQYPQAWPDDFPAKQFFKQLYQADKSNQTLQSEQEYLTWIFRFYNGVEIYPQGWKNIETDMLDGIGDKRYSIVATKLHYLGELISGEWAKHNSVRHITTAMLSLWGQVIEAAIDIDKSEAAINLIITDVLSLLSGNLMPGMIEPGRYEAKLGISLSDVP